MNIIILSGGSGKRLWPLTNGQRSKQFIKCLKKDDGTNESMLQRVYRQTGELYPDANITVAANQIQVETIRDQIGEKADVSAEPCGRDTFAAIAFATAYLTDIKNVDPNEAIIVCPSDFYSDGTFFKMFEKLACEVEEDRCDLALIGKNAESVNTEYGYIIPKDCAEVSEVNSFAEKPDAGTAEKLIAEGALWNCGVFAFRAKFVLGRLQELTGCSTYEELKSAYPNLPRISFDNAVVEKCVQTGSRIRVVRYNGEWKDIGTWNSLTAIMDDKLHGNVIVGDDCGDINAINELGIPILLVGVDDLIVSATNEGILITRKEKSGTIKKYIDRYY